MPTTPPPIDPDSGYEASVQVLDRIFEEMHTSCGYDDAGNELRYPANYREIEIVKLGLKRLDEIGCTDPGIVEKKRNWQKIADNAGKRKFHGSWKFLAIAFGAILIMSWGKHPFSAKTLPDEAAAQSSIQQEIALKENILQSQLISVRESTGADKQMVQNAANKTKQEIADLKTQSPAQYLASYNKEARQNQLSALKLFLGWMVIPVLYFLSGLTPLYLVMRRRSFIEKSRKAWGIAGRILTAVVGAFMAVEATEYVVRWSDGSTTRDSDIGGVLLMKVIVLALVAVLFIALVFYVLPIITLCNFVANYTPGWGEKLFPLKEPMPAF
jgi:uncharacterized membrane-anchored protein